MIRGGIALSAYEQFLKTIPQLKRKSQGLASSVTWLDLKLFVWFNPGKNEKVIIQDFNVKICDYIALSKDFKTF